MSQLTTNTTTIDECITLANSLPDAGSGGGAVETCTVTINAGSYIVDRVYYLAYETDEYVYKSVAEPNELSSCVCNTPIVVVMQTAMGPAATSISGSLELDYVDYGPSYMEAHYLLHATDTTGGNLNFPDD